MTDEKPNERNEYRIVYPLLARPRLDCGGSKLEVIDVSEHGARVSARGAAGYEIGTRMSGTLQLAHGVEQRIEGNVVRLLEDGFAIKFDDNAHIPMRRIIDEQRHLRSRYPSWR